MRTSKQPHQTALQPRNWPIDQLPGLSEEYQSQLEECGINTTEQLIKKAGTPASRLALASQLQIHIKYVNKWVALASLACIPNVGCRYCGLLLHAGIASVAQLAQTPTHRLHQQILRLHVANLQRRDLCPSVEEVAQWIKQAKLFSGLRMFEKS